MPGCRVSILWPGQVWSVWSWPDRPQNALSRYGKDCGSAIDHPGEVLRVMARAMWVGVFLQTSYKTSVDTIQTCSQTKQAGRDERPSPSRECMFPKPGRQGASARDRCRSAVVHLV